VFSTAPDRPNCVNYELPWQTTSARDLRFTCLATAEHPAFGKQFRACAAMNRAIDTATAKKCRVRRVYNRVNLELRDVGAENFDPAVGIFHESLNYNDRLE
jgi:hypothetical protein